MFERPTRPRIPSGASPIDSPRNGDCPRKSRGNAGGETLFLSILRRTRDLVLGKCCKKRRRLLCSQTQTLCHARLRFRTHFPSIFGPKMRNGSLSRFSLCAPFCARWVCVCSYLQPPKIMHTPPLWFVTQPFALSLLVYSFFFIFFSGLGG